MSLFGELKKGIFFTPLPPIWTNVSFSAIFFLKASKKKGDRNYLPKRFWNTVLFIKNCLLIFIFLLIEGKGIQ